MVKIEKKKHLFKNTLKLFKDIELKLRQIPEFDRCELQWNKVSILRNKGNVQEQTIHRDQATYE